MILSPAHDVQCPHCNGTGIITVSAGVEIVEAYYFGCWKESGHYWKHPTNPYHSERDIINRVGSSIHPRIDGGFCPGAVPGDQYKKTRSECEGEASLHHVAGWTILSLWDRSVDGRSGSNSSFVVFGTHDYATMLAVIDAQFSTVWKRFKFEVKLVEEK